MCFSQPAAHECKHHIFEHSPPPAWSSTFQLETFQKTCALAFSGQKVRWRRSLFRIQFVVLYFIHSHNLLDRAGKTLFHYRFNPLFNFSRNPFGCGQCQHLLLCICTNGVSAYYWDNVTPPARIDGVRTLQNTMTLAYFSINSSREYATTAFESPNSRAYIFPAFSSIVNAISGTRHYRANLTSHRLGASSNPPYGGEPRGEKKFECADPGGTLAFAVDFI